MPPPIQGGRSAPEVAKPMIRHAADARAVGDRRGQPSAPQLRRLAPRSAGQHGHSAAPRDEGRHARRLLPPEHPRPVVLVSEVAHRPPRAQADLHGPRAEAVRKARAVENQARLGPLDPHAEALHATRQLDGGDLELAGLCLAGPHVVQGDVVHQLPGPHVGAHLAEPRHRAVGQDQERRGSVSAPRQHALEDQHGQRQAGPHPNPTRLVVEVNHHPHEPQGKIAFPGLQKKLAAVHQLEALGHVTDPGAALLVQQGGHLLLQVQVECRVAGCEAGAIAPDPGGSM
eukprot:8455580-Pyramimonas_sp.AAC.1